MTLVSRPGPPPGFPKPGASHIPQRPQVPPRTTLQGQQTASAVRQATTPVLSSQSKANPPPARPAPTAKVAVYKVPVLSPAEIEEMKKEQKRGIDLAIFFIANLIVTEANTPKKPGESVTLLKKIVFPELKNLDPKDPEQGQILAKYNSNRIIENKYIRLSAIQRVALAQSKTIKYEHDEYDIEKRLTNYFSKWVAEVILDNDKEMGKKENSSSLGGLIAAIEPGEYLMKTNIIVNACFTVAIGLYRTEFKFDLIRSFHNVELWKPPGAIK